MIEYIKTIIISFISGMLAPVAVSSSAHYAFIDNAVNFSQSKEESAFYFSIITIVFSLVAIFFVRKIYLKGFKSAFGKTGKIKNVSIYKSMMISLLISLLPVLLMLIPVSSEKFLLDYFTSYLWKNNILVSAFCCVASGLILFIALWYAKQKKEKRHRNSSKTDVLRMSIYQAFSHIFPGLSHISTAATSLIVSGVDETVLMREIFVYTAPSMLIISIIRAVRCAVSSQLVLDPVKIIVCAVSALLGSAVMFNFVSKVNIRKSFVFFSVYSIIFGIFMVIASLFIL